MPALACVLRSVNTVRQVGLQIDNSEPGWASSGASYGDGHRPQLHLLEHRGLQVQAPTGEAYSPQIRAMDGCEVVRGTAEEVNESELDYYGRYFDKAKKFTRG